MPDRKRIFICYRRDDTSGQAGRLYDHLNERLGQDTAFMDVDAIPAGEKFDAYIDECLRGCFVCIVAIGQRWNSKRLHDDDDFVRKEILAAMSREVRVVPVLFDGAKMPAQAELPAEIKDFALCQAFDFGTGRDFRSRVDQLLKEINRAIEEGKQRDLERSREALRGIALRPYQYPLWVIFFCALIALSVIVSVNSVADQVAALRSLSLGEKAASRGDRDGAIASFRNVLTHDPASHRARIALAVELYSTGSPDAAKEALATLAEERIDKWDWARLQRVMPSEHQKLFEPVKQ